MLTRAQTGFSFASYGLTKSSPSLQTSLTTTERLTVSLFALRRLALCNLALLLEINIPTFRCTGCVFQREREDGVTLLDGVLAVRVVRFQRFVDGVEGG